MKMLIKFILLCTIAIIYVQGRISNERIASDAARWTELNQEYMNRSPNAPFRGQMKTKCRIMLKCCPNERNHFFDLMRLHKFEATCINTRASLSMKSRSKKCNSLIRQLNDIKKSNDYSKFNQALSSNPKSDQRFRKWRLQMANICSSDELEAHYCEPDNAEKFRSCQRKVLTAVALQDETHYAAYVREMKSDYNTYIQRLSRAFPNL
jgi:hypothetical protein